MLYIVVLFTSISLLVGNSLFRIIFTIGILLFTCLFSVLFSTYFVPQQICYYPSEWRSHKISLKQIFWPKYSKLRLFHVLQLIISDVLGLVTVWYPGLTSTMSNGVLFYITSTLVLYIVYYWIMKIFGKEFLQRPFVFITILMAIILSICCWGTAFYFWRFSTISPADTPSIARTTNRDCILFNYFDDHDL